MSRDELPEYIRNLRDELEVRIEVETEIAAAIDDTIRDAIGTIGSLRTEKVLVEYAEVEANNRLRRIELERKRAGLA